MKRIKKVNLFIIGVISLFLGVNGVKAASPDQITLNFSYSTTMLQYRYHTTVWNLCGNNLNMCGNFSYAYTFVNPANGKSYQGFCRMPDKMGSKSGSYRCQKIKTNEGSERRKRYNTGLLAMMKTVSTTASDRVRTSAAATAMRVYETIWGGEITQNDGTPYLGNVSPIALNNQMLANEVLHDPEFKPIIDAIGGMRTSVYHGPIDRFIGWYNLNGTEANNAAITAEYRRLLKVALEAARDYKSAGGSSSQISWNDKAFESLVETTEENGTKYYKKTLSYTFDIKDMNTDKDYFKLSFECPNCVHYAVGYSFRVVVDNKEVTTDITEDLLKYIKNGTGKITVNIDFYVSDDFYACEKINYKLIAKYYGQENLPEVYNCQKNSNTQNFYILYTVTSPGEGKDVNSEITGNLRLCKPDCNELKRECENGDSESCKEYEEKCSAQCNTYVGNAECTANDSEIDIKEGYEFESDSCTPSNDKANVLKCIIDKSDKAGNSYQAKNLPDNKYCNVWCKEDYHFVLPGNKEVNSGRYFSLKASIKGTKACYTSKIDKDQFEIDYENARKKVIDAFNEWSKYYNGVNNHGPNLTAALKPGAVHSSHYYNCSACPQSPVNGKVVPCPSESERCSYCSGNQARDYQGYSYNWNYQAYNYNGGGYMASASYNDPGSTSCGHDSCASYDGKDITSVYNASSLAARANSVNAAIRDLENILKTYNDCSQWIMDYKFEPEIEFNYQETYMASVINKKLDTIGSTSISGANTLRCKSDTNDQYEDCATGWTSDSLLEDIPKFVCKAGGAGFTCGTENKKIAQTIRMKQSIDGEGNYITPTQFYTIYATGSVATATPGTNIENGKELTNALPVGLGTPQGVYSYSLVVSKLGEYYDNSNLGRIWGSDDSVVSNALNEENACNNGGALKDSATIGNDKIDNGVYVCAYKVNCPDCPVECEPDHCYNPDCPDGLCPVECNGCLYTNGKSNVSYRPITSEDLNPNNRELGKNWQYNEGSVNTALEMKAYATTKEIEDSGDKVYDINFEDSNDMSGTGAIKVTMDSKMISKIRAYNKKYENDGGYANSTLKCYDYKNSNDSKTYKNIYCYSTFIDELLYDNKTKNSIKIKGNRIIGTDAKSSDKERKTKTQNSGYWTTWSESKSDRWTINTQNELAYKSNYGQNGIGPSWK